MEINKKQIEKIMSAIDDFGMGLAKLKEFIGSMIETPIEKQIPEKESVPDEPQETLPLDFESKKEKARYKKGAKQTVGIHIKGTKDFLNFQHKMALFKSFSLDVDSRHFSFFDPKKTEKEAVCDEAKAIAKLLAKRGVVIDSYRRYLSAHAGGELYVVELDEVKK